MSLKKRKKKSKNNKQCSTSHHSSGTPLEETRLPCVQEHRTPTCGFLGINFERWQLTHLNLCCIFVRLRNWPFQSQLWAPAGNFMEICGFRWQWIFPALSGILFSDYSGAEVLWNNSIYNVTMSRYWIYSDFLTIEGFVALFWKVFVGLSSPQIPPEKTQAS